ncbi:MAG: phytanoyl-CoA dioxygenase family protein [Dongiaceae bacterium]
MDLTEFHRDGYQRVIGLIPAAEIPEVLREFDRLRDMASGSTPLDPRLRALWTTTRSGQRILRVLQNAHWTSPVIDALRLHPGVGRILKGILGPDVKTVLTSAFWKPAGEIDTGIAYHQDAGFRQPAAAYRNLAQSYVSIAIALDPQDEENGALHFIPGSHRQARLFPRPEQSVLAGYSGPAELRAFGVAPDSARAVRLDPGDAVMWNAFTLHGSPPNSSADRDRRSLTIGSMRLADCDHGVAAYIAGRPVPVPRGGREP